MSVLDINGKSIDFEPCPTCGSRYVNTGSFIVDGDGQIVWKKPPYCAVCGTVLRAIEGKTT